MTIRLEKETKWSGGELDTKYWVLLDGQAVDIAYSEEEGLLAYEKVKANCLLVGKEVIREEEI